MAKSPRAADDSPDRDDTSRPPERERDEQERIAQRAYERYEARGRGDGHDQEDWFEAEREFRQGASAHHRR
jgi:DUF2934 family protein